MTRTHFYSVAPVGVGSVYVESLSGYFARLAQEHCVSADRLARELVRCYPDLGNGILYRHFFVGEARSMDGMGRYAWEISAALETLTDRRDLRGLTMRRWTELLDPRARSLLRESRAWCPECLLEQVSKGAPPYDQLVWRVKLLTRCARHGSKLVGKCPSCGAKQPIISRFGLPGTCHLCDAFLGAQRPASGHPDTPYNEFSLEADIRELVKRNGIKGRLPTRSAMLKRMGQAWKRGERQPGVPVKELKSIRAMFRRWQGARNRPMLASLCRFAWLTRTRPVWLLDGSRPSDLDGWGIKEAEEVPGLLPFGGHGESSKTLSECIGSSNASWWDK